MSETVYLRPSSDISLSHSCSSGSFGYAMMSEVTADGDSTYIYAPTNGADTITTTSSFNISANIGLGKRILSAKFVANLKHTASENMGEATHDLTVTIGSSSGTHNATKEYAEYTTELNTSDITLDDNGNASATAQLVTKIKPLSSKEAAAFQFRITQIYIELTIEDIENFYIKIDGVWKNVKAYQKVNGAWVKIGYKQPNDWASSGYIMEK